MDYRRIVVGLLSCLIISGCAFGTRYPLLNYTVITEPQPKKNINVHVARLDDERLETEVIGHVRNAYGMKTAKVITATNIPDWVTAAIKAELQNIGYTITDKANTGNIVEGEVIKVYCDSYIAYDGEVGLEITLKKGQEEVFSRKYLGKDSSINIAARAASFSTTLERCLQKALGDAIHDIDRALTEKQ